MCYANNVVKDMRNIIEQAKNKYNELGQQLSKYDRQINELYHLIEINKNQDVIHGYKIYKELRSILRKRRLIKHELMTLRILLSAKDEMILKSVKKVDKLITEEEMQFNQYAKNWKDKETIDDVLARELQKQF